MNSQASQNSFRQDVVSAANDLRCLDIIGTKVANLTQNEAMSLLFDKIASGEHTKISFLNAHNANIAQSDTEFGNAIDDFLLFADGFGVDIAAKFLHGEKFRANLNGTDFIPALLRSAKTPLKVALYGAKPGIADKAAETFSSYNKNNHIRVVGHGFISKAQQAEMLRKLEEWHPDIVLVAMGVPRQELWIAQNLDHQHCTLAFGIGALFDFAAGNVRRAPKWVRAIRMEWAFRLANEPTRLARRYLLGNPLFLMHTLRYKLSRKSAGNS